MKKIFLLLVTIIFSVDGFSQAPAIQWQNTIGGDSADYLFSIKQTADGGFILGGWSISNISGDKTEDCIGSFGNADYWIVKTDGVGNIQWQNIIGGDNDDYLISVQQTSDGGYILGGYSFSGISGDKTENWIGATDYWLVKTDAVGNIQWQNTIGGNQWDELSSVQQTSDGGYILGGWSNSNISGDKTENNLDTTTATDDYWIVKTDAMGNIQWQNTIGGTGGDALNSLHQTGNGGYILGGISNSNISGDKTENCMGGNDDYWIVKTDAIGNIQWQNTIGGSSDDVLTSIQQTGDGGYILGGFSGSNISGDKTENNIGGTFDYWVVKTDDSGDIQWQNTIGGSSQDRPYSVRQTSDGGFILGGYSWSNASGDKTENNLDTTLTSRDYWVVKIDATGNIQWQNTIGGNNDDNLYSLQQTSDGGYILGGYSLSNISGDKTENSMGDYDYWIVKLAPPVGIDELAGEENIISLFPNPATTAFTIYPEYSGRFTIYEIEIYNALGEKVFIQQQTTNLPATQQPSQWQAGDKQQIVDVSQLLPGVYFVAVTDDKGNKITRRFIKM